MIGVEELVFLVFVFVSDNFVHFRIKSFNRQLLSRIKIPIIRHDPPSQVTCCFAQTLKFRKACFIVSVGGTAYVSVFFKFPNIRPQLVVRFNQIHLFDTISCTLNHGIAQVESQLVLAVRIRLNDTIIFLPVEQVLVNICVMNRVIPAIKSLKHPIETHVFRNFQNVLLIGRGIEGYWGGCLVL